MLERYENKTKFVKLNTNYVPQGSSVSTAALDKDPIEAANQFKGKLTDE